MLDGNRPVINDPFWDAFRYVSGEMSNEERGHFEERLGRDLDACEAVAEATELHLVVREIRSSETRETGERDRRARRWPRAAQAAAIGAFACLAIWGLRLAERGVSRPGDVVVQTSTPSPTDLGGGTAPISIERTAMAWVQVRASAEGAVPESADEPIDEAEGPLLKSNDVGDESLPSNPVSSWMIELATIADHSSLPHEGIQDY